MFLFNVKKKRTRGTHSKRRKTTWLAVREYLWPSIGWLAYLRWTEIRIKRRAGSAHNIAMGFACGAAVSFTPFLGFHFILAALFAWILRGNILASAIGTIIGNPWTFPFIWLTTFELGKAILGTHRDGVEMPENLDKLTFSQVWDNFSHYFDSFILPMTAGGIPLGLAAGVILYWFTRLNIENYRRAREEMLRRKRSGRAAPLVEGMAALKDKIMHPLHHHKTPSKKKERKK